jgi:hypothetical protein
VGFCVIGVVSGFYCLERAAGDTTDQCGDYAAGGNGMVTLIQDMRSEYP